MILSKLKEKQIPYLFKSKKIKNCVLALFLIGDFFLKKFFSKIKYFKYKRKPKIISLLNSFSISQNSTLQINNLPDFTGSKGESSSLKQIPKRDFDSHFSDIEDFFKLHRFSWLWTDYIAGASSASLQEGLVLIKSWISKNYDMEKDREIFESYSISERVINWILFLVFSKGTMAINEDDLAIISQSIIKQLGHLVKKLEFKGQLTNNHILKNAQALYIGGAFLHDKNLQELGRLIITEEYDDHITEGYLQEDSSHYQLIITRWFIEVFYSANVMNDFEFKNWLGPRLENLINVCRKTFLADGNGPFFGDISPDLPVETLLASPFLNSTDKKSPWNFFVSGLNISSHDFVNSQVKNMWFHKKFGKFDLFIMAKNKGIGSHGHEDNGSFVLFCDDRAIIQDLGRKDYTVDSVSVEQQKQAFHSIPCMDQSPWDIKTIPHVIKKLFSSKFEIIKESELLFKYKITSFDSTVILERAFLYNPTDNTLSLQDKVLSRHKEYALTLPVKCPIDLLTFDNSKIFFTTKDLRSYFVSSQCQYEAQEFFMSDNYGSQERCALLIFKKSLGPDEIIEYRFGCEGKHA